MTDTSDVKSKLKDGVDSAAQTAKDAAQSAAQDAKSAATAKAHEARDGLAGEMHNTADALRRAADEVRDGSPQGSTFSFLADGLADMADSVKDQNVNDIFGTVNAFARRNPVAFLGGAALLGFAASRYAKASAPTQAQASTPGHQSYGSAELPTRAYPASVPPMEYDND